MTQHAAVRGDDPPHPPLDAVVVGAGVVGLTTAISLAEAGLVTRLLAADPPERTTSYVAGAIWGPVRTGVAGPVLEWARVGLEVLSALAGDPRAGIRQVSGVMVEAAPGPAPDWLPILPDQRPLTQAELPAGFACGWRYTAPVINMPTYLAYLAGRYQRAGGSITIEPVTALCALQAPLIVNCTGMGARELVPDPLVTPVRGQVVVVANPGLTEFYRAPSDGPESVYVFPHEDVVVLGGTADEGAWDLAPSQDATMRILRDCCAVYPQLTGAPIIAVRVGLRPYRPRARLESEGLGDGRVLWHNYGHGGAGVTLAWGCARELTEAVVSGRGGARS
jgi:D-amino-acid oxidase